VEVLSPAVCDNDPIVSVIVPCFKQARFLPACLASLQAQSMHDWEMVIVNDGSPDDAAQVATLLLRLDARVRFVDQRNAGPSAARNAGLRVSRGQYVQFLDADDLLAPTKLARHAAALDADSSLALIYGNAWYFDDANPAHRVRQGFGTNLNDDWIARLAADPGTWLSRLIQCNLMPICSPMFRRSLVDAAGLMDESLRALEDWEFWIRCANANDHFRFDPSPDVEALIRLHPSSASQNRAFMFGAELGMRVRTMAYLRDRKARRLMLACIGRALTYSDDARPTRVYAELATLARGLQERTAVWLAQRFGAHAPAHALIRPCLGLLPWYVRTLMAVR